MAILGARLKTAEGYILVRQRNHPFANANGRVYEHRLVVEAALGRYLQESELVHHINGIEDDNRIENLMICDAKEHSGHHPRAPILFCKNGHPFSEGNTKRDKHGWRSCLICRAKNSREWRKRQRSGAIGRASEGD